MLRTLYSIQDKKKDKSKIIWLLSFLFENETPIIEIADKVRYIIEGRSKFPQVRGAKNAFDVLLRREMLNEEIKSSSEFFNIPFEIEFDNKLIPGIDPISIEYQSKTKNEKIVTQWKVLSLFYLQESLRGAATKSLKILNGKDRLNKNIDSLFKLRENEQLGLCL